MKHHRKKLTAKEIAAAKVLKDDFQKELALKLLALAGAWILVLYSFVITEKTFVPNHVILLLIAVSGSITILPVILLRRYKHEKVWSRSLIRYFLIGGAISYFLFSAINYYGPHEPAKTIQLPVLETGTAPVSRSQKRKPYVIVAYNNGELRIYFEESFHATPPRAKIIELQIEKGFLGYYRYTNKKLIQ